MPGLRDKLKQAGMVEEPEEFVKNTLVSSFYLTTGLMFFITALLSKTSFKLALLIFIAPFIFLLVFLYLSKLPEVKIFKRRKQISKEIIFAGRFLIIELESGISLYDAIKNVANSYKDIGIYFKEITDKVEIGTTLEDALNESIEYTPSDDFRRMLWQIVNSLKTGSDIAKSLRDVIEQITREQNIEMKKYGRTLNPLAMFYMIVTVIVPSLGVTILIVLATFMSIKITLAVLLAGVLLLAFVQFMFISIIKSLRPAIEF
ncbi:type II secretion system F family protein [Candidatus Woesearchaeota archaeon]|nr:type II secretion system F family protein [Candidatus Woesearchaeota archaeon]